MSDSRNKRKVTQKKSHNSKGQSKNKSERTRKKSQKRVKRSQAGGAYEDSNYLDFMKMGIGFSKREIKPMPQPPCSIL